MEIQTELVKTDGTYSNGRLLKEILADLVPLTQSLVGKQFMVFDGAPSRWPKHVEHVACYAIPTPARDARVFIDAMCGGSCRRLFLGLANNMEDGYRVAAACAAALNHQ